MKINIEVLKKKSEQELLSAQALLNDNEANQSKAQQNLSDLNKERDSLICEKVPYILNLKVNIYFFINIYIYNIIRNERRKV